MPSFPRWTWSIIYWLLSLLIKPLFMFGDCSSVPLLFFLWMLNKSSSFILSLQIIFLHLWSFLLLHSRVFHFSPRFIKCNFSKTGRVIVCTQPVLGRGIITSLILWIIFSSHVPKMNLPFSSNNIIFVDAFLVDVCMYIYIYAWYSSCAHTL